MAENEYLDLNMSRRWRVLADMFRRGAAEEVLVRQTTRNLYLTFKKVLKEIPLRRMLDAAARGEDLTPLVRESKGHDYANLIRLEAEAGPRSDLMARVVWATLDKFVDQIGVVAVGEGSALHDFKEFVEVTRDIRRGVFDSVQELSRALSENPNSAPALPRESAADREERRKQLTSLSLIGRGPFGVSGVSL